MPLDRATIVRTAIQLLERTGIEGLSLRKLAEELGVQAPSLYWHFPNKLALLEDMANEFLSRVGRDLDTTKGSAAVLQKVAEEMRSAFLAHRDGARVSAGTFVARENVLRVADVMIGTLREAGYGDEAAVKACFSLFYFVLGLVIEEQASMRQSSPDLAALTAAANAFPHVRATLPHIVAPDWDARFKAGLHMFISGMHTDEFKSTARVGSLL